MKLSKAIDKLEKRLAANHFRTKVQLTVDHKELGQVELVWTYSMETRDWGIKSIIPIVPEQKLSVHGSEVEVKSPEVNITGSGEHGVSLALAPHSVEIVHGKATVEFRD
jgi:hypothetical protein